MDNRFLAHSHLHKQIPTHFDLKFNRGYAIVLYVGDALRHNMKTFKYLQYDKKNGCMYEPDHGQVEKEHKSKLNTKIFERESLGGFFFWQVKCHLLKML